MMSKEDFDHFYPEYNEDDSKCEKQDPDRMKKRYPNNRIPKSKKRKRKNK